jgi:hypothetical protein
MAAGAALVLVLHAVLLLALPAPRPPAPQAQPAQPPLVWLLPPRRAEPPPAPPPAPPALPAPQAAATTAPRRNPPGPAAARTEPQAITLPAPPAPAVGLPAAPATTAPPAASAHPDPAPALDLRLPRGASAPWRTRHPALDEPRLARERRTLEPAIAAALGGDERIVEERLDADRVRVRSGSRCVLLKRSRAGQLDLAGGALRELWAAGEC